MNYRMGWKGSAAFQAFTPGGRELVFDLAEGTSVPEEFKEGDEIDINLHPDHPANIQMGMNSGYYEFTHLKTGVKFQASHATSEWRFDKVCQPCDLRIQKVDQNYVFKKPGKVVPTKLSNFHVLKDAFHSSVCPLCDKQMEQDIK
ncbi:MAG: hypothetical protein WAN65_16990 [Candidatus Sulfotelmatobacter sp.]